MYGQRKDKAIVGVAIAMIILATLMAVLPTVSAKDITNQYLTLREPANMFLVNPAFVAIDICNTTLPMYSYMDYPTDAVKIGQELIFSNTEKGDVILIEGIPDTNTDGEAVSASAFVTETVTNVNGMGGNDKTIDGIYFDTTSMGRTGTYILSCPAKGLKQALSVSRPIIPIELKVGPDVVSTITVGTKLRLDCSGISDLDPNDCVDLEITNPKGHLIKTWTANGVTQYYDEINVRLLREYGSSDETKQIDTTDWLLGTYSFSVISEEENARGLDMSSVTKTLTMRKGEVDVNIDKAEVGELESVTVTVTGVYGNIIHIEATAGEEYVEFEEGLDDCKDTFNRLYTTVRDPMTGRAVVDPMTGMPERHIYGFDLEIEEDGQMEFSVRFHDTGAYTIEVIDYGKDGIPDTTDDGDGHTDEATVKILPAITPTTMRLYKNWNFISVPKKLADGNNTFEQVFGDVDTFGHSIYYYNTTEGWSAVNATEEVKPLSGYRIYSVNAMVVNLTYDVYPFKTPPTRVLYKGWNAIGLSDTKATAANSALTSIEKSWAYLIGFDADKQEDESAIINNDKTGGIHDEDNLMYPMKGYLIYVTEDCALAGISA